MGFTSAMQTMALARLKDHTPCGFKVTFSDLNDDSIFIYADLFLTSVYYPNFFPLLLFFSFCLACDCFYFLQLAFIFFLLMKANQHPTTPQLPVLDLMFTVSSTSSSQFSSVQPSLSQSTFLSSSTVSPPDDSSTSFSSSLPQSNSSFSDPPISLSFASPSDVPYSSFSSLSPSTVHSSSSFSSTSSLSPRLTTLSNSFFPFRSSVPSSPPYAPTNSRPSIVITPSKVSWLNGVYHTGNSLRHQMYTYSHGIFFYIIIFKQVNLTCLGAQVVSIIRFY